MDSVSTAFELMFVELDGEEEGLNSKGADAFQNSEYDVAQELIDKARKLKAFRDRLQTLAEEWQEDFSQEFPEEVVPDAVEEARRTIMFAQKSAKTTLLVRFPEGDVIANPVAAQTFADTIERLGLARVSALGLTRNNENLVSKTPSVKYRDIEINGYFVKTHSSTKDKKRFLDEIAARLGVGLDVKIVTN